MYIYIYNIYVYICLSERNGCGDNIAKERFIYVYNIKWKYMFLYNDFMYRHVTKVLDNLSKLRGLSEASNSY